MINMNLKVTSTARNVSFSQHPRPFHPVDVEHRGAVVVVVVVALNPAVDGSIDQLSMGSIPTCKASLGHEKV